MDGGRASEPQWEGKSDTVTKVSVPPGRPVADV